MSKEVKIKITVDGKQVEKSVKDLTKEFNIAEKSVSEINQRLKELKEAAQQVATGSEEFRELNEEIRRLNLETKQAAGALNELGQREPLSNVRKGFEDTAFAITSVNTVLGIANELFSGNEKIQKIINRTQLAFNAILTATQLIKEKEAIIDGVRNVKLVAYNALLPVATNLTRIFGITTAQAMAVATAGVSLLVGGFVLLISQLNIFNDESDKVNENLKEEEKSTKGVVTQLLKERDLRKELAKIKGDSAAEGRIQIEELTKERQELEKFIQTNQNAIESLKTSKANKEYAQQQIDISNQQIKIINEKIKKIEEIEKKGEDEKNKELSRKRQDYLKLLSQLEDEFNLTERDKIIKRFEDKLRLIRGQGDREVKLRQQINEKLKAELAQFDLTESIQTQIQIEEDLLTQSLLELDREYIDGKIDSYEEYVRRKQDLENKFNQTLIDKGLVTGKELARAQFSINRANIESIRFLQQELDGIQKTLDVQFSGLGTRLLKRLAEFEGLRRDLQDFEYLSAPIPQPGDEEGFKRFQEYRKLAEEFAVETDKIRQKTKELINESLKLEDAINSGNLSYEERIKLIQTEIDRKKEVQDNAKKEIELTLDSNLPIEEIIKNLSKQLLLYQEINAEVNALTVTLKRQQSDFTVRIQDLNEKFNDFFIKYEAETQILLQSIQTINDVTAAAFDFRLQLIENERLAMEERYDRELELLNRNADENVKRVENSLLSEEVKASEIKRLRDQEANDQKIIENRRERERRALERERNRTQQKSAISQAIMGAALAVIQAFAQLGPIAGAIASAGIITTTGLQIATIKRQKFNKGGKVKGPGSDMSDSIPAMLSNGESVINANSTKMFEPLLSKINEIGGGVRFNRGGVAGDTPTMTQSEIVDIEKLARRIGEEMRSNPVKAYVIGNEVSNQQQIDAQIKRRSIV